MKIHWYAVIVAAFIFADTVFALSPRPVRSVGQIPQQRERVVIHPGVVEEHVDTLRYEDPEEVTNFLTLPDYFDLNDLFYNVRFTPLYAPFQIFAVRIPLYDLNGQAGRPGMVITIWESGEQDGEPGYPTDSIVTIAIPYEDLIISPADSGLIFNTIDLSVLNISFNDEVDFHISISVIGDEENDSLAIYMDDGEYVEDSRSGLFLGADSLEEFPWIKLQDLEDFLPYNFAIHAVIGEPLHFSDDNNYFGTPRTILMEPAYPNPFNEYTTVKISVPNGIYYQASLIDPTGRLIQRLSEGVGNGGQGIINIQAGSYPAGTYFLQLASENNLKIIPLVYLK